MRNWLRGRLLHFLFPGQVVRISTEGGGAIPLHSHRYDAGYDLVVSEPITIPSGEFVDVSTGIKIQLPEGIWVRITGRSSTFRNHRLQVQEGIIDGGYIGPLFVGVWNFNGQDIQLKRGDRIAQIIFHIQVQIIAWELVSDNQLRSLDGRGSLGFGSTNYTEHVRYLKPYQGRTIPN